MEEYVIVRPFAVTIQVITSKYMIVCDKLREIELDFPNGRRPAETAAANDRNSISNYTSWKESLVAFYHKEKQTRVFKVSVPTGTCNYS